MRKSLSKRIFLSVILLDLIFVFVIAGVGLNFKKASQASDNISETYIMIVKDFGDLNTNMQALMKRHFIMQAIGQYLEKDIVESIAVVGIDESKALIAAMDDLKIRAEVINSPTFTEASNQLYEGAQLVADGYINTLYNLYLEKKFEDANTYYNDNLHEAMLAHDENIKILNEELNAILERTKAEYKAANAGVTTAFGIGVVFFVIASVVVFVIVSRGMKPLNLAKNELDELLVEINSGNADLSRRIKVRSKDEIGVLVSGINNFLNTLQDIIVKISDESGNIYTSVETTSAIVDSSKNDISNVSSVMEELSASMDTTNDFIGSISEQADTVNAAVTDVAEQIVAGNEKVQSIKTHAVEIKANTEKKKTSTYDMVASIQDSLEASITESKNVEQIQSLTEDILSIASQTNLLALNASIEAARAGEAGKGFAVVADEIRQLADHSRETANSIQDISSQVVSAVGSLASNSNDMLVYVSDTVLKDYDEFLEVANQYAQDADDINEVLANVNDNTNNLNIALSQMTSEISQISDVIGDCAKGVSDATVSTGELLTSITNIQKDSVNNKNISQRLQDEVSKFSNGEEQKEA